MTRNEMLLGSGSVEVLRSFQETNRAKGWVHVNMRLVKPLDVKPNRYPCRARTNLIQERSGVCPFPAHAARSGCKKVCYRMALVGYYKYTYPVMDPHSTPVKAKASGRHSHAIANHLTSGFPSCFRISSLHHHLGRKALRYN